MIEDGNVTKKRHVLRELERKGSGGELDLPSAGGSFEHSPFELGQKDEGAPCIEGGPPQIEQSFLELRNHSGIVGRFPVSAESFTKPKANGRWSEKQRRGPS